MSLVSGWSLAAPPLVMMIWRLYASLNSVFLGGQYGMMTERLMTLISREDFAFYEISVKPLVSLKRHSEVCGENLSLK